jgi:DNA-binding Lrp family transcriptional regulator
MPGSERGTGEEKAAMSVSAYIFVETTTGKAREVSTAVAHIPGVVRCNTITGPYDVIALVEAESMSQLGDFVVSRIQAIPGVLRTMTNIVAD